MAKTFSIYEDVQGGVKKRVILLILLLIIAVSASTWYFYFRQENEKTTRNAEESKIECHSDDKTLCKYITSWEQPEEYRYTIRETTNDTTTVSVYEYDLHDPPRIHARVEGGEETITIGDTIYTKWDGFWSKKTIPHGSNSSSKQPISKPSPEDAAPIEPHNYQRLESEKCGSFTCFKYKITDPQSPGLDQYIWFDNQEYKLRQLRFESEGSLSDQVFEYVPVEIEPPTPIREE